MSEGDERSGRRLRAMAVAARPVALWTGRWLARLATVGLTLIGVAVVAVVAYYGFLAPSSHANPDPEALANAWDEAISQFGVSPIFPPQEDLRVGDLYAVLGDDSADQRPKLKFPRAIKLDHLTEMDDLLATAYDKVYVMPPSGVHGADAAGIVQEDCKDGCFAHPITRTQLPLVIFPGFSSAHERSANLHASMADDIGRSLFGASREEAQRISMTIAYAENYGLPSLVASGILNRYCNDAGRPRLCDENNVREQLAMVAGELAWQKNPRSARYEFRVYIVLVSSVFLTRSIKYGFSSDSAVGIEARAYKKIQQRLLNEAASTPAPSPAAPSESTPNQRALEVERQRLLHIVGEAAGLPSGGSVDVETTTSDRVVVDQSLPRPVAIGFIPVVKDFRLSKGKNDVVEPE